MKLLPLPGQCSKNRSHNETQIEMSLSLNLKVNIASIGVFAKKLTLSLNIGVPFFQLLKCTIVFLLNISEV